MAEGARAESERMIAAGFEAEKVGDLATAADWYWRAVADDHGNGDAWNQLGVIARRAGNLWPAVVCFKQAIASRQPPNAYHLSNLGESLQNLKLVPAADAAYGAALEMDITAPTRCTILSNMGAMRAGTGDYGKAIGLLGAAVDADPTSYFPHLNLVRALQGVGDFAGAAVAAARAVSLAPDLAEAHWNNGIASGCCGRLGDCFAEMEWRLRWGMHGAQNRYGAPGTAMLTRDTCTADVTRIVLIAEQGYGDLFMFCRYAAAVRRRYPDALLTAWVPDSARRLLHLCGAYDHVAPFSAAQPEASHWLSMGSLPHLLGVNETNIAPPAPYLAACAPESSDWEGRLARLRHGGNAVGVLVWRGSPQCGHDADRSIPAWNMAQLGGCDGVAWVSAQVGPAASEAADIGIFGMDAAPLLDDWGDTAALLAAADFVVACDTGIVHLAGAMGVPAVCIMRPEGEWRWLSRDDPRTAARTPWYDTVQLHRRNFGEGWMDCVARAIPTINRLAQATMGGRDA